MTFGMTEPGGGTDVLGLSTRADLENGGWVERGQKLYTSATDDANSILLLARTDPPEDGKRARGLSLVLTPRHQPAVQVRRLELMGMRAAERARSSSTRPRPPPMRSSGGAGVASTT